MIGFDRRLSINDRYNTSLIGIENELDNKQISRLKEVNRYWDYFEGYHWEEIPEQDSSEITVNFCRAYVKRYVAFELGHSFTYAVHKSLDNKDLTVTDDGRTLFDFLEDVWEDNKQYKFSTDMGQMKSVTGEAWVQIRYLAPDELDDPFEKYPNGRIRVMLMPTSVMFPEFDPHDKDILVKLTIMYMYEKVTESAILKRPKKENVIYKQVWTKDKCVIIDGKEEPQEYENEYGIIPFVQIKNLTVAGSNDAISDLADIVPLNMEYNMKDSNMSEIIDYHSAPVTIVYGAKVGNLEKGANKLWGGLPKDAKVDNLELKGDLSSSYNYASGIKEDMQAVSGVSLSPITSISNTSGVALQYLNMPLIDVNNTKKIATEDGLELINSIIILIALKEGIIKKPDNIPMRDFCHNEVTLPDNLPKDYLIELQMIQIEMKLGLEDRKGAMKRLGKENVDQRLSEIDADRKENPELYSIMDNPQLNSGIMNGQTPQEEMNKTMNGSNVSK